MDFEVVYQPPDNPCEIRCDLPAPTDYPVKTVIRCNLCGTFWRCFQIWYPPFKSWRGESKWERRRRERARRRSDQ